MGFFNKIFGDKEPAANTASPKKNDFIDALALHLRGEIDPALGVYLQIIKDFPNDYLAPFFISAIMAGQGQSSEAAANLRSLSQQIAGQGGTISQSIYQRIVVQMDEALHLSVPAVAGIIATFGDRLKGDRFLQESAVCFEIAKGLDPENADLLYKLGDTLHDLRNYDYAESVLKEALKSAPEHWGALYTYGVLLQDLGRFAEAISYYEKAVAIDPDHATCQNNFGAALLTLGRGDEALAHCTRAIELNPDFALARINLGNIHLGKGEYEAARTCYSEALALDETLAPAYFGLGSAEKGLGSDSARVEELYRKAMELNPAVPVFQRALDNLLAAEGKEINETNQAAMDATTLAYDDNGSGPPLLLIHGFPLNRTMWRLQVAALTKAGYRVITPDLRGFGESRVTSAAVSMSSYADDIVALMDELRLPQAVVGGMSMGGYVLLNLLERYPERVSAAIFIVTKAGADDEAGKGKRTALAAATASEGMNPVLDLFRNILFAPATLAAHPELVAEVSSWISATDPRGAAAGLIAMRERKDYLPLLGTIRQPVLVIGAEEDQVMPSDHSRAIAAGIAGAQLSILPAGGHLVNLEQPDEFNAVLKEFLARQG